MATIMRQVSYSSAFRDLDEDLRSVGLEIKSGLWSVGNEMKSGLWWVGVGIGTGLTVIGVALMIGILRPLPESQCKLVLISWFYYFWMIKINI